MCEEDQRALGIFERKVLPVIYGGVRMEDGINHELHHLLTAQDALLCKKYNTVRKPNV